MTPILECHNLSKRFGSKEALNGIELQLEPGHIVGLLGPNGSGKTTLIKLINGLLVPNGGEILVDGIAPGVASKSIISYLPERTYLADWMRVSDIIRYFEDFYEDFDTARATEMLHSLQIDSHDKLQTMSKGTREKVQLILVMSRHARFYILDEPIAGVDPAARDYILRTILSNYDPNATILLSTHLISDVESILDQVIFLDHGTIRLISTVDEIRESQGKSVDTLFREVYKC